MFSSWLNEHETLSVLIVEDSQTQANQLRYLLEKHGFAVQQALHGKEAMALLEQSDPHLVISDILMPEMDGYALCHAIRQHPRHRDLPVVLLTSLSSARDILLALECKADHFITKPYNESYLLSRMASILETMRQRRSGLLPEHTESDIFFQGEWFHINTDRQRILDLLMATYEAMVLRNDELITTQHELSELNGQLQLAVAEANDAHQQSQQILAELSARDRAIRQTNEELRLVHGIESLVNQSRDPGALCQLVCDRLNQSTLFGIIGGVHIRLLNEHERNTGQLANHHCQPCFSVRHLQLLAGPIASECEPGSTPAGRMVIPLLAQLQPIGLLCAQTRIGLQLDPQQRELLESLGRQIGMALENIRLFEETRVLSLHDPLTGLANRRHLEIAYSNLQARTSRSQQPFGLILLDIDHFKRFNDTYGHPEGDQLLIRVAEQLRQCLRSTDLAVRFGGEEFMLLVADSQTEQLFALADRIRQLLQQDLAITASFGLACYQPDETLSQMTERADEALYRAKHAGRNRVMLAQGEAIR
jgi:diguanylate cyclase (GGDEF) domain